MKTVKDAIEQFGDEWWYEIINENGQMVQDGRIEDMGEYMEEMVDQVKFIDYGDIESQIIKLYIA